MGEEFKKSSVQILNNKHTHSRITNAPYQTDLRDIRMVISVPLIHILRNVDIIMLRTDVEPYLCPRRLLALALAVSGKHREHTGRQMPGKRRSVEVTGRSDKG